MREIPTGSELIHELKWDGYRLIARRENDVVHSWSRTGGDRVEAHRHALSVWAFSRLEEDQVPELREAVIRWSMRRVSS